MRRRLMMSAGLAVIMASAGGAQAYSAGISIVRVGSATSHDLALSVTRGLPIQSVVPAGGGGTLGPGRMPLPDTLHLSLRLGTSTADRLIYSFNRKPDGRANGEAGFATRQTGDSTTYAFRMQFEGLIAQLSLPALDGASKTACAIDAGILPGSISAVLNAAKKVRVQPAPAATCLLSDFEVTIDRMGKLRVVSVDTIILRRVGAVKGAMAGQDPAMRTWIEADPIKLRVGAVDAASWFAWYSNAVLQHNITDERHLTLTLSTLRGAAVFRLEATAGIVSYTPVIENRQPVPWIDVVLYANVTSVHGAGSPGAASDSILAASPPPTVTPPATDPCSQGCAEVSGTIDTKKLIVKSAAVINADDGSRFELVIGTHAEGATYVAFSRDPGGPPAPATYALADLCSDTARVPASGNFKGEVVRAAFTDSAQVYVADEGSFVVEAVANGRMTGKFTVAGCRYDDQGVKHEVRAQGTFDAPYTPR